MKLKVELALWQQRWKLQVKSDGQMQSATEILKHCNKNVYHTIHTLHITRAFFFALCENLAQNKNSSEQIERVGSSQYKLRVIGQNRSVEKIF